MKKIITILIFLISINLTGQQIDSIKVAIPKGKILKTLVPKDYKNFERTLDSLSDVYKVNEFNIYKYIGKDLYKCRIRKTKIELELQSI